MLENQKFSLEQINNIQNYIIIVGKNLKDLYGSITKYNEELDNGNFPATLKLLPKISLQINNLNIILKENNEIKIHNLENEISEIITWIGKQNDLKLQEDRKMKYKQFFISNLSEIAKSKKLEVEGAFPNFRCNNFKLKLDERKFSLKLVYGGDQEKMKVFDDWNLEKIFNYINNFYEFFEKINLNEELEKIYESYINCLKNKESEEGICIIEVLSEYKKNKQNAHNKIIYSERAFFSFLILKISENSDLTVLGKRISKRTATHSASGKNNEHLWIPRNAKDLIGQNIGYLNFIKETK